MPDPLEKILEGYEKVGEAGKLDMREVARLIDVVFRMLDMNVDVLLATDVDGRIEYVIVDNTECLTPNDVFYSAVDVLESEGATEAGSHSFECNGDLCNVFIEKIECACGEDSQYLCDCYIAFVDRPDKFEVYFKEVRK